MNFSGAALYLLPFRIFSLLASYDNVRVDLDWELGLPINSSTSQTGVKWLCYPPSAQFHKEFAPVEGRRFAVRLTWLTHRKMFRDSWWQGLCSQCGGCSTPYYGQLWGEHLARWLIREANSWRIPDSTCWLCYVIDPPTNMHAEGAVHTDLWKGR